MLRRTDVPSPRRVRLRHVVLASLATAALPAYATTPLTTTRIASGLDQPVFVTATPHDEQRLFVVEQKGTVRVVKHDVLLAAPFLDIQAKVALGGERGLLGLAFHPEYAANGRFFVDYTRSPDGAVVVEEYLVSASPDHANAVSGKTVLVVPQPAGNHNGGMIAFGPDGLLYVGTGDGGGAPTCVAQDGSSLLGKLLRVDVDHGAPYTIPASNPFTGDVAVRDEIWSLGLRNPWRFSFDRATGDLYVGDVGHHIHEEVNVRPASSAGGENYGWPVQEAATCFGAVSCPASVPPCFDAALLQPVLTYDHFSGDCSVSGGAVYRGCAIPDLQGTYFFGDFCSGRIWSFRWQGGVVTELTDRTAELAPGSGQTIDAVVSFGEDADGELIVVDHDGELYRIVPRVASPATDLGSGKVGGNGLVPTLSVCGLLGAGESALVRLRDAPPQASSLLVAAASTTPQPAWQGTLLPDLQTALVAWLVTDVDGHIDLPATGGGGPFTAYVQLLIDDPGATSGVGFSNALAIGFGP